MQIVDITMVWSSNHKAATCHNTVVFAKQNEYLRKKKSYDDILTAWENSTSLPANRRYHTQNIQMARLYYQGSSPEQIRQKISVCPCQVSSTLNILYVLVKFHLPKHDHLLKKICFELIICLEARNEIRI